MISIILCTFNRESTIEASIDSILQQTYQDWELIIVDDGSTDSTRQRLEAYQDSRIRCIYLPENSYYCYAANVGMAKAVGEYIAFATSDDIWEADKLELQAEYLAAHPECGAVFSKVFLIGADGERVDSLYPDMVRLFDQENRSRAQWIRCFFDAGNCLSHPSAVVRKSILDQIGGYDLFYAQLADMDLWLRIILKSEIYVLPEQLVGYRWYSAKKQISGQTEEKKNRSQNEFLAIKKRLLELMTDEQLIEYFGDLFRNQTSRSPIELGFERMFLLMEQGAMYTRFYVMGLQKAEEVLRIPGAADVLRDHFGVRLQDLYRKNGAILYAETGVLERIRVLEQENAELKKELDYYRPAFYEVVNSTVWKCTKPMRGMLDWLKRRKK
ncbi:MAG TPA: hypothetical protein DCZ20_00080 [Lachnospiraceae bacterium]|nr:hypothetical protein [Lachnospiraceae bacterium]